jgi:hypothetical protein
MSFPVIFARRQAAGPTYDTDAAALFAAMSSQPDATRKGHYNTLITSLKTAGVWSKLGLIFIFAAHTSQAALLNLKNPGGTPALAAGSPGPTFTTDRGFTGDATGAYIDTQTLWTAVPGVAQDNAHASCYAHFGNTNSTAAVGLASSANVNLGRSSGNLLTRANAATAAIADTAPATAGTHLAWSRSTSGSFDRYVDGAAVTAGAVASSTPIASNLCGLRANTTYAPSTLSLRAMHAGSALTAGEVSALRSAMQAYMAAVGAS